MKNIKIYLDDIRTPVGKDWLVVRNFHEFVNLLNKVGMNNVELISLDHDLGDTAMNEYFTNVSPNYHLNYDNIIEKTGYDVAKFLVNHFYDLNQHRINMSRSEKKRDKSFYFPRVMVHSANPIGAHNICGYINNFLMNEGQPQDCIRVIVEHTV
jgi:hypothetical protein